MSPGRCFTPEQIFGVMRHVEVAQARNRQIH
jgi:hypothetical protein